MRVKGMAETLCACPPIQDAAKSLPCGRTWCSGSAAAVGHSTYRHPIELLAAPEPSVRGANTSRSRPRSSSGYAEGPQGSEVGPAAVAWRTGGPD
jgi:hypothetical protein